MKKEQTYIDKRHWPHGEWKNEPDRVSWVDSETGYPCLIKRNQFGTLCGYVAVDKNHTLFEKDGDYLDVHGGITFSDHCQGDPEKGICHVAEDGDHVWWFGFDCGHAGDHSPGMHTEIYWDNIYRNISYVTSEVESLAEQLKAKEV